MLLKTLMYYSTIRQSIREAVTLTSAQLLDINGHFCNKAPVTTYTKQG